MLAASSQPHSQARTSAQEDSSPPGTDEARNVADSYLIAPSYDAVLARILALEELPIETRLSWICKTRATIVRARQKLSAPAQTLQPLESLFRQATVELLDLRLRALDETYRRILEDQRLRDTDFG
jgi:hypothetical protein